MKEFRGKMVVQECWGSNSHQKCVMICELNQMLALGVKYMKQSDTR